MKKLPIKIIVLISLLSFFSMANATTGGGKTKPPSENSSEDRAAAPVPAPTPTPTPSFWDWIKKHFYM